MRAAEEPPAPGFTPILTGTVDLDQPLPPLRSERSRGGRYGSVTLLVRLHGQPIELLSLAMPPGGLSSESVAFALDGRLRPSISKHLAEDGLPPPDRLGPAGITTTDQPACQAGHLAFLADPPAVTVIIPTRDRPAALNRCLRSLLASHYPPDRLQLVVVDNAPSGPETEQVVEQHLDSDRVRYVREERLGSASARNRGLQLVETELVAFTDDDAITDPDWLTALVRGFDVSHDVTAVTGLLLPQELETPAQLWFEQYGGFTRGLARQVYDLAYTPPDAPLYPYSAGIFGTGNNMAFRRAALREIGDFDPALGNGTPARGGVDSEVLLRTILHGGRIVYEPAALVRHIHREDYAGLRRQVYSYGVGLSAYLLKTLLTNPRLVPDFCSKLPQGVSFALSPGSSKNSKKAKGP